MRSRILSTIAVLVSALSAQQAFAQQPVLDPILRIDPGMPTAMVKRVGVDDGCTLLATGSDDKTIRLWRLPEGKLVRTLRPPIGPGHDGKVFATAMSPDGTWVAAGGWDAAFQSAKTNHVYIFQSGTGAIVARVGETDGKVINHIAISHDGRRMAVSRHLGQGVEVWQRVGSGLNEWRLEGRDSDYGGQPSYGVGFDRTGALYAVGYDGRLRRYSAPFNGRPDAIVRAKAGRPYSVAVHPSGDRVAIGYEDTRSVDIYDAPSLRFRASVDARDVNNGDLAAVTWSADGTRLLAAGSFTYQSRNIIISWDNAGEGRPKGLPGPQNTVTNLVPCGNDVVFAAQDPPFGIVVPAGGYRMWPAAVQADLRGQYMEQGFSVSADARRVRFGLETSGRNPVLFDLVAERVTDAPNREPDLSGPDTRSLAVTDWVHNPGPRLDGRPLTLEQYERARALAIAPDRDTFVLGADWSIRGYDRRGQQVWSRASHGTLWAVNIPRDGKVVVAAHGDGTIRWHRLSDGEELLALFVHAKDRRWVAWTPKGYYMASPGAETLVGWHVNKGWNEASQFFSVDRFREQFNRPDIVKLALATGDENRAIQEANLKANIKRPVEDVRAIAPPIVVIQKPEENATFRSPEITLEYYAFSPTGQRITDIDVRINNQSLASRAAVPLTPRSNDPIRMTVTVPPEDVTITLVAREGTRASQPATLKLRWDGAKPGQPQRPRLRALLVGVNDYLSPHLTKLKYAAKDATDLAAFFKSQEGRTYQKVEAKVLPNARRGDVLEALDWLERSSEEGDINLLFLAGHGITDEQQQFYYMAADSEPERARSTGVGRDEILRTIRNRKGAMVVMLDACHSADTAAASKQSRVDMNRLANELGDKSLGVFLYASALGRQFSFEHADWQNGAFTKAMLEGLTGGADRDKLGYVDTEELSLYVRRRVLQMTNQRQEPVRMKPDATPELRLVLLK
jgi:WD40 repeat protein